MNANNTLPSTSAVIIGAATLYADTCTDTVGTLTITAAATIRLGTGAALPFADSSAIAWPGTLAITGSNITYTFPTFRRTTCRPMSAECHAILRAAAETACPPS
jgi:hypothetical protein